MQKQCVTIYQEFNVIKRGQEFKEGLKRPSQNLKEFMGLFVSLIIAMSPMGGQHMAIMNTRFTNLCYGTDGIELWEKLMITLSEIGTL